jgi:DNA-binding beta-propeller fold protein YncE
MSKGFTRSITKMQKNFLYVVANDPVEQENTILGYHRTASGELTPLPGSPYRTGGTGYVTKHVLPHFGPFDLDQNIVIAPDGKRLLATNGGSDTVAVFDIADDGGLQPVPGSPFPSGGRNPVSLGFAGHRVYVVNKNEDPGRDMRDSLPNYSGFEYGADGRLDAIPGAKVELETPSRSPTQALVVRDRFLYDGDFGSFFLPARRDMWGEGLEADRPSSIRTLRINSDGTLTELPQIFAPPNSFEGGMDTDGDGAPDVLMFGLQAHPRENVIYISFVTGARLAVYRYDDAGQLEFVRTVPNSGGLICWVRLNKAGTRAYTTNNASNTLSVYDTTDAENPREIQHVTLPGQGHPYQIAISPEDDYLCIVKHRTFDETPVGQGNVLNAVRLNEDGCVTSGGMTEHRLPVRDDLLARPQGVVVI